MRFLGNHSKKETHRAVLPGPVLEEEGEQVALRHHHQRQVEPAEQTGDRLGEQHEEPETEVELKCTLFHWTQFRTTPYVGPFGSSSATLKSLLPSGSKITPTEPEGRTLGAWIRN